MTFFSRFRPIGSAYQQAKPLRDIAGVLLKYGYDDLPQQLPLPRANCRTNCAESSFKSRPARRA